MIGEARAEERRERELTAAIRMSPSETNSFTNGRSVLKGISISRETSSRGMRSIDIGRRGGRVGGLREEWKERTWVAGREADKIRREGSKPKIQEAKEGVVESSRGEAGRGEGGGRGGRPLDVEVGETDKR